MRTCVLFLAGFLQVALAGCSSGESTSDEPVELLVPFADATANDPPLCRLKSGRPATGEAIDQLRSQAETDLSARKPGMNFDFERAMAGPMPGQASLLFANLTYLDQYYVYVSNIDERRLERVYRTGGIYYPEANCEPG
ncbi:hypothetical protein [Arenimonas alkanexedens]